jgi:hypothetical protein
MKTIAYPINRFALRLMLFSLCFGILQTIVYAIYPNDTSLIIGFLHLFPTVIIHTIVLIRIIANSVIHNRDIGEHFLVIITMLANIPIAMACNELVSSI